MGLTVEVTIVTAFDGFVGDRYPFQVGQNIDEQIDELCSKKGWMVGWSSRPVLLHGATDYILCRQELQSLPPASETRLAAAVEVLDKLLVSLKHPTADLTPLQVLLHNARPDSWFLKEAVSRGAFEVLCEREHPTEAAEWEFLLAALCALLEDYRVQDAVTTSLNGRKAPPLASLALHAFDMAPTPAAVQYSSSLIRHFLLMGPDGLGAIFRAETELRVAGHELSFSRALVEGAIDGDTDALQIMNDFLIHCPGMHSDRLLQEIRTEAKAVESCVKFEEFLEQSLLSSLSLEERCGAASRLAVGSERRLRAAAGGIPLAQAAREASLFQEVQELKARLKGEQKKLARSNEEIRRLTTVTHEMADFLDVKPSAMKDAINLAVRTGWSHVHWNNKYTPLHLAAQLNRYDLMPMLLALRGDPHARNKNGNTPLDVARVHGGTRIIEALQKLERYGGETGEQLPESFSGDRVELSTTCCSRIRRCCLRLRFRGRNHALQGAAEPMLNSSRAPTMELTRVETIDEAPRTGLAALTEELIARYARLLGIIGEEKLVKRLQAVPELGGLSLNDDEVDEALRIIRAAKGDDPEPVQGKGKGKKGPAPPAKGKGKGNTGPVTSKQPFKPAVPMKPMWWNKIVYDENKNSKTVWAHVPDLLDKLMDTDIEQRFGQMKTTRKSVFDAGTALDSPAGRSAQKQVELLRIIKDPNVLLTKELAFKNMPKPVDVAEAVLKLDDTVLAYGRARTILDHGAPTDEQLQQLTEVREANPGVPWALAESYLWQVGQISFYRARLHCLIFLSEYEEQLAPIRESLTNFETTCQELRSSDVIREYLGCVLAVGNYLNGGTSRGQADGFDIEQLGKLNLIKDNDGKDMRYFLATQLSPGGVFHDIGSRLFDDLATLSQFIRRRAIKTTEGTDTIKKQVRGSLEDLETQVRALRRQFDDAEELLQACLQGDDLDPTDALRLEVPERFDTARHAFEHMTQLVEAGKSQYKRVQLHFSASQSKSGEFMMLWDEALLPTDLLALPAKIKTVSPQLCGDGPVAYEDFVALWDFTPPSKRVRGITDATPKEKDEKDASMTSIDKPRRPRRSRATTGGAALARRGLREFKAMQTGSTEKSETSEDASPAATEVDVDPKKLALELTRAMSGPVRRSIDGTMDPNASFASLGPGFERTVTAAKKMMGDFNNEEDVADLMPTGTFLGSDSP